jgi:glutamine amidotransferase
MVRSSHFIGHIRASTVGETSRANCHPFTWGKWSFCHNGQVPHYARIRRRLEAALPDELYTHRRGTTDSEMIFLTLLANGLEDDAEGALKATLAALGAAGDEGPIKLTIVFSDGETMFAFRHSSDGTCPTLYLSGTLDHGGRALASEPLCGQPDRWTPVPADTLCRIAGGSMALSPLIVSGKAA